VHYSRPWNILIVGFALVLNLAACDTSSERAGPSPRVSTPPPSSASPGSATLPPVPSAPGQSLGPNQPPIVWVGGEITRLRADRLELREAIGSVLTLRRLGGGATSFYRAIAGSWERVDRTSEVEAGTRACVETLIDGQNLLALRVFLGADCGPVA